jgi:hypothetical protein
LSCFAGRNLATLAQEVSTSIFPPVTTAEAIRHLSLHVKAVSLADASAI